jgi:tRNA A37 methylthiotransferase MiaB
MAGLLAEKGYGITHSEREHADVWLLNSCTVKTPSEDTFNNDVLAAKAQGKHVVLAGCVPQVSAHMHTCRGEVEARSGDSACNTAAPHTREGNSLGGSNLGIQVIRPTTPCGGRTRRGKLGTGF